MKKTAAVLVGLMALACVVSRPAGAAVLGFDVLAAYYLPRDSRYVGVGVDVAVNTRLSKDLEMGYRVEELNVQGLDQGIFAVTGFQDVQVRTVSQVTFQGVQGWYTLGRALEDRLSGDIGLWFGAATTSNFTTLVVGGVPTAVTALTSPFIEPQARGNYISHFSNGIEAKFSANIGYRFVRNWNLNTPFFAVGGIGGAAYREASRSIKNFDGLDVSAGFGLMF